MKPHPNSARDEATHDIAAMAKPARSTFGGEISAYAPRGLAAVAVVILFLKAELDDGIFEMRTWCCGETPAEALTRWVRSHRKLAACVKRWEVATQKKPLREETWMADGRNGPRVIGSAKT